MRELHAWSLEVAQVLSKHTASLWSFIHRVESTVTSRFRADWVCSIFESPTYREGETAAWSRETRFEVDELGFRVIENKIVLRAEVFTSTIHPSIIEIAWSRSSGSSDTIVYHLHKTSHPRREHWYFCRGALYKVMRSGPATEPWGTPQTEQRIVGDDVIYDERLSSILQIRFYPRQCSTGDGIPSVQSKKKKKKLMLDGIER